MCPWGRDGDESQRVWIINYLKPAKIHKLPPLSRVYPASNANYRAKLCANNRISGWVKLTPTVK